MASPLTGFDCTFRGLFMVRVCCKVEVMIKKVRVPDGHVKVELPKSK